MGKLEASMENPVVGRDATMVKRKMPASAIDDGHSHLAQGLDVIRLRGVSLTPGVQTGE